MYSKNKTDLVELGYTVIDDFLPIDMGIDFSLHVPGTSCMRTPLLPP